MWLGHWLVSLARVLRDEGRAEEALEPLHRSAVIQRRLGDRSREATALDCTGEMYQALGRLEEAAQFHRQAAKIHRELGDNWQSAVALDHLARVRAETEAPAAARPHWREAEALLARFPDPRAGGLRERIRAALGEA